MDKTYERINWENEPSIFTPLNAINLNKMDSALNTVDTRVVEMDTTKAKESDALLMFNAITFDQATGKFTFTRKNGQTVVIDTLLEKVVTNFTYDPVTQKLKLTTPEGEVDVDLSALITQYEFVDTTTIDFTIGSDGKVSANVIDGSITGSKLEPNYLANVTTQAGIASTSATSASTNATLSKSYAVGDTGSRTGEDTDNAKYYCEQAKEIVGIDIATTSKAGLVKPDGNSITVETDGTIHSISTASATESPITSATGNINAITLYGESRKSKNLLKSTIGTTTIGNVTFTSNGDGTYTLNNNGTVTQSSISPNGSELMSLGSGTYKYIVSNNENIRARVIEDIDGARTEKANATKEVTFTASSNAKYLFQIWTTSNATYSNVVIKPMLTTDTTLTYADYEPYGIISADGEVECSVNSFDGELMQGFRTADGINTYNRVCETLNYMPCESGNKINVTTEKTFAYIGVTVFNANKTYISSTGATYSNTKSIRNYAIPSNAKYFTVWFQNTSAMTPSQVGEVSIENVKSSINASTICPTYSLYGIDTIKNTLEVYADGSGKFVSKIGSVNLGSLSWAYYSDFGFRTNNYPEGIKAGVNSVVSNILCTKYIADTATNIINSVKENTIGIGAQKHVFICDKSYTDATSFKNAMNGQILLYELATPTETPLTAEEVAQFLALKTFKGTTNINADCGYKISYYLDNNVAQGIANVGTRTETNTLDIASTKAMISDAWSSSKTYAQGEFCIYNNALWKSKVSSNTGNTPTESSYWTSTSIGERIKNSLEMRSTVTKNIGTTIGANATVGINSGINATDNDICMTRQTGTYGVCITPFINANNIWCANVMNLTSSSIPTGLGIKFDILNK